MLVCCLPTQNFQAGSVGRKFFFLLPVQVKDTILRLNYLQIEGNNFFFRNDKKKLLDRGKMVGLSVDSKPKYFKGWPYTR